MKENNALLHIRQGTSEELARAVYRAEVPVEFIKSLPAQSLYMAIQAIGLESAFEVLELTQPEQYKLLLDFEFWQGDCFTEERFWRWLSIIEHENSLRALEKFLHCVDIRLIGVLVARHVHSIFSEEPTDPPPGVGYYTPDKGHTWISINFVDPVRHRLFGKLLALFFETKADVFYQLLAVSEQTTPSEFEEESYQDKNKRLLSQGVPDHETGAALNGGVSVECVREDLKRAAKREVLEYHQVVLPLVYQGTSLQPLTSFLEELLGNEAVRQEVEAELTLIANAALVFYRIDFSHYEEVSFQLEKIKGALNIGLEKCREMSPLSLCEIHETLGLQKIYQLGIFELHELEKFVQGIAEEVRERLAERDLPLYALCESVLQDFPVLPEFFNSDGSFAEETPGKLVANYRAFSKRRIYPL